MRHPVRSFLFAVLFATVLSAPAAHAGRGEPPSQRLERQTRHRLRMQHPIPRREGRLLYRSCVNRGQPFTLEYQDRYRDASVIFAAREAKRSRQDLGTLRRRLAGLHLPRAIGRRVGRMLGRVDALGLQLSTTSRDRWSTGDHVGATFQGTARGGAQLRRSVDLMRDQEDIVVTLRAEGRTVKGVDANRRISHHGIESVLARRGGTWTETIRRISADPTHPSTTTLRTIGTFTVEPNTGARSPHAE
jgi:hypothetical protein